MLKNYSYFILSKWNQNWRGSFSKNPPDDARCSLNCIKSKDGHQYKKTIIHDNFAFIPTKDFLNSKGL